MLSIFKWQKINFQTSQFNHFAFCCKSMTSSSHDVVKVFFFTHPTNPIWVWVQRIPSFFMYYCKQNKRLCPHHCAWCLSTRSETSSLMFPWILFSGLMLSVNHLGISASFSETLGDEGGGSSTSPEGSSVIASSASTSELKALAASCRAASLLSHCDPSHLPLPPHTSPEPDQAISFTKINLWCWVVATNFSVSSRQGFNFMAF